MSMPMLVTRALALCCLPLLASAAGAASDPFCGTPSPSLEALGEAYYSIDDASAEPPAEPPAWPEGADDTRALPALAALIADRDDPRRRQAIALHRLLERLHEAPLLGGHGERRVCRGSGERAREALWLFDLEDIRRVETLDGRTSLTAFESRHTVLATAADDHLVDGVVVAATMDVPPALLWHPSEDIATLRTSRRLHRVGARSPLCTPIAATPGGTPHGPAPTPLPRSGERCTYLTEIALTARTVGDAIELEQVFYVNGYRSERVLWRLDS